LLQLNEEGYIQIRHAVLLFLVLHFLVYPSSNVFNSLQDEDKGSTGLFKKPLPVPMELACVLWGMRKRYPF